MLSAEGQMSVIVQSDVPEEDKTPTGGRPQTQRSQAGAVRFYSNELDEDFDLVEGETLESIAAGGKADIESGDFILIESQADADALYERIMRPVQAEPAVEKG